MSAQRENLCLICEMRSRQASDDEIIDEILSRVVKEAEKFCSIYCHEGTQCHIDLEFLMKKIICRLYKKVGPSQQALAESKSKVASLEKENVELKKTLAEVEKVNERGEGMKITLSDEFDDPQLKVVVRRIQQYVDAEINKAFNVTQRSVVPVGEGVGGSRKFQQLLKIVEDRDAAEEATYERLRSAVVKIAEDSKMSKYIKTLPSSSGPDE